jgi:tetratricopeptide (TPR) repeat protein
MKAVYGRAAFVPLLLVWILAWPAGAPAQTDRLGRIEFPTSGASAAQEHFLRGVLWLHNFEYEDAREEFRQAQKVDPGFVLAYWGEAMTYNHPLWREQDRAAAREALERLAPTPAERLAKAPTEREKGYLRAVEVLYGEGDKVSRDFAYAEAMRHLREQFPDDLEAASFHALSILGTAQGERNFRTYMKAAAVVEEVFDRNPRHPGAAHYLIHSYDDPVHAPLGLRAARVYNEIAPAASHAQHMISHIFVALGSWDETVTANVKSYEVSVERATRKQLPVDARNYHALHWLEYGLLQQGRYAEAREKAEMMEKYARASRSPRALWYYAAMRAAYGVETGKWNELPPSLGAAGVGLTGVAIDLFATGFAAAKSGDTARAEAAREELRKRIAAARETGAAGADDYATTTETDIRRASILGKELAAQLLFSQGKTSEALALLQEATAEEESLPFAFGPPTVVKPSHELLGEALLELGRPAAAQEQFEITLERAPRRTLALLGLARAASRAGDTETAQRAYEEARSSWRNPDAELPALQGASRSPAGGSTPQW